MKIVKVSLVCLMAVSFCGLQAMKGHVEYRSLENEPVRSTGFEDEQRTTEDLRKQLLRQDVLVLARKKPVMDSGNQGKTGGQMSGNSAGTDGQLADSGGQSSGADVPEESDEEVKAIIEANEQVSFDAKPRSIDSSKSDADYRNRIKRDVGEVQQVMFRQLREPGIEQLIKESPADRSLLNQLSDRVTVLSDAINKALEKKNFWGKKTPDKKTIGNDVQELRDIQKNISSIVKGLREKSAQPKKSSAEVRNSNPATSEPTHDSVSGLDMDGDKIPDTAVEVETTTSGGAGRFAGRYNRDSQAALRGFDFTERDENGDPLAGFYKE